MYSYSYLKERVLQEIQRISSISSVEAFETFKAVKLEVVIVTQPPQALSHSESLSENTYRGRLDTKRENDAIRSEVSNFQITNRK